MKAIDQWPLTPWCYAKWSSARADLLSDGASYWPAFLPCRPAYWPTFWLCAPPTGQGWLVQHTLQVMEMAWTDDSTLAISITLLWEEVGVQWLGHSLDMTASWSRGTWSNKSWSCGTHYQIPLIHTNKQIHIHTHTHTHSNWGKTLYIGCHDIITTSALCRNVPVV